MVAMDERHYCTLIQNPSFTHKHPPQFLQELGNVYRNNRHLSPFFRDIRAFADDLDSPEIVLILKGENISLSGNAACDAYDKALYEFLSNVGIKTLWLGVTTQDLADKLCALFSGCQPEQVTRHNFRLNADSFCALSDWRTRIPARFSVVYYDTQSANFLKKHKRSQECWFPESKRFAFAALYKKKIVSECFSVFIEENMVEIGIATDKRFRRRGLAFLTCAAFIDHCLQNGLETNWGCWHYNYASAALAKKLGYELFSEGICVRITL